MWTTHGPASFATHLQSLGIDAEHIAEHPNEAGEPAGETREEAPPRPGQLGLEL